MSNRTKKGLAKRLGTYSLAAGAAAAAGSVTDAQAAPITYDTEATPIQVSTDFFAQPANMAVIDPTVASAGGLLGLVVDSGSNGDGILASSPSDALLSGAVYFRYQRFPDHSASGKSGTQFGILAGPGNGLYAGFDATSVRSPSGGGNLTSNNGFDDGDIIGDGDVLLTSDTATHGQSPAANAIQGDLEGHGSGASGWDWDIVQGVKYLGFRLGGKNGFVKVNEQEGRERLQILGWGIETVAGTPIAAEFVEAAVVPEPGSLALLALGASGLLAYRSIRKKERK